MSQPMWYALKTNLNNEERICRTIINHATKYQMFGSVILAVEVLKEYQVSESAEIHPKSDLLPKKSFRNTKKLRWLRLKNGYYKKIRIIEKKPFQGMIFIKINWDPTKGGARIFSTIRSWVPGTMFLGTLGNPAAISEATYLNMAEPYLNPTLPNLETYLAEHHLLENTVDLVVPTVDQSVSTSEAELDDWSEFEVVSDEEMSKFHDNANAHEIPTNIVKPPVSELELVTTPPPIIEPDVVVAAPVIARVEEKPPVSKQMPTTKVVVQHPEITWKVGDIVWVDDSQCEGEVKKVDQDNYQLHVEIEMFGRSNLIEVAADKVRACE